MGTLNPGAHRFQPSLAPAVQPPLVSNARSFAADTAGTAAHLESASFGAPMGAPMPMLSSGRAAAASSYRYVKTPSPEYTSQPSGRPMPQFLLPEERPGRFRPLEHYLEPKLDMAVSSSGMLGSPVRDTGLQIGSPVQDTGLQMEQDPNLRLQGAPSGNPYRFQ